MIPIPGTIVRLTTPFKPDIFPSYMLSRLARASGVIERRKEQEAYTLWQGFTHGIVCSDGYDHVQLYLYDPYLALIYVDNAIDTPPRVGFSLNEFSIEGI